MKSARSYNDLKTRLDELRKMLPVDSPTGLYTSTEQDLLRAYVVLAHAEIESFLEELALEAMERARRKARTGGCPDLISRLILFRSARKNEALQAFSPDALAKACEHFTSLIAANHGLKARHVLGMFLPLGVNYSDFDEVFLSKKDALGGRRGDVAHTGARLQQGSSPSVERERIDNLLPDLSRTYQVVRRLV